MMRSAFAEFNAALHPDFQLPAPPAPATLDDVLAVLQAILAELRALRSELR